MLAIFAQFIRNEFADGAVDTATPFDKSGQHRLDRQSTVGNHNRRHVFEGRRLPGIDPIVREPRRCAPAQYPFLLRLNVVAKLETDDRGSRRLPDEQVKKIVLEPAPSERGVVLLDASDFLQH